jgi:photosystem II stability/assembly factor-like uncharacterized protein
MNIKIRHSFFTAAGIGLAALFFLQCSKQQPETPAAPEAWERVKSFPLIKGVPAGILHDDAGNLLVAIGPEFYGIHKVVVGKDGMPIPSGTIYRSKDGGKNWEPASDGIPELTGILNIVRSDDGYLYILTRPSGIYRAESDGLLWRDISKNLPPDDGSAFAISPKGTLYCGLDKRGLFRSTDHGNTWKEITGSLPDTRIVEIAVDDKENIVLMTKFKGGFHSSDGGVRWDSIPSRLFRYISGGPYYGLYFGGNKFYAYASGSGIEVSSDRGTTWPKLMEQGVGPVFVFNDSTVYVGIHHGVARLPRNGESGPHLLLTGMDTLSGIAAIGADKNGTIFAATMRGLYRLANP